ncbi:unnamed protein product [Didymodactylos carnosus]|nr:unnamed protein product [Didymodactylos carnosus]CAF3708726.1 unnamed protein product [Didymodactylos carnosus]
MGGPSANSLKYSDSSIKYLQESYAYPNAAEQYLNGNNLFRPNINQLPNNQQQQAAAYYRAGAENTNDPLIPIRTSGNGLYSGTHSEHGNSGWYSNHQSGGGQSGLTNQYRYYHNRGIKTLQISTMLLIVSLQFLILMI